MARYLKKSQPEMSGSLGDRGAFPMISRSGGLKPRAVAGRPSVTRFTHNNWTGISASGRPRAAVRKILRGKGKGEGEVYYSSSRVKFALNVFLRNHENCFFECELGLLDVIMRKVG